MMLRNTPHVGRSSPYAEVLARAGFVSNIEIGVWGAERVAPPFTIDGRFGTNPICIGLPRPLGADPLILDMGTSWVEGKVRVALEQELDVRAGVLVDNNGAPTTDPRTLYLPDGSRGAILPTGGPDQHKLGNLGIMIELATAALSGQYNSTGPVPIGTNVTRASATDLNHLLSQRGADDKYGEWLEARLAHFKTARLQPGAERFYLPGEKELTVQANYVRDGVPVTLAEWKPLFRAAKAVGLSAETEFPDAFALFGAVAAK